MNNLVNIIKNIMAKREPNKIESIECNFEDLSEEYQYNYVDLIKYWKHIEKKDKNSKDEIYQEYKKIKDFGFNEQKSNVGIFSLFYFKDNERFLSLGKFKDEFFHLDIKCPEYQKVLSDVIEKENEVFILTYWII